MSLEFFVDCIEAEIKRDRQWRKKAGLTFTRRKFGNHTVGDFVCAVLAIEDEDVARRFYEGYVEWLSKRFTARDTPENIACENIGWCFGEGMKPERIAMWQKVCGAYHPIFGATIPSSEDAVKMGMAAAKGEKKEKSSLVHHED